MIINVDDSEGWPEKQPEYVSTVFLADEGLRIHVNVLDRLGIRKHKVLLLRNQITNLGRSQLKITHPEEAMKFKSMSVLLLPLVLGFAGLVKVEICEVSKERIALLRAREI